MEDFYAHKNILLTGATGFLGKVILEKILRSLPNVGKVFVFVRSKKGEKPHDRVERSILNSRIFDTLRSQRDDFLTWARSKVECVEGDLTAQKLGIGEEATKHLQKQINIVIHCAATLDFDEPFDQAFQHNVQATLELFDLAKGCENIQAFTHVSTAYVSANMPRGRYRENFHYMNDDMNDVVRIVDDLSRMTPQKLRDIGPTILKRNNYPNTYTYTKCLTEHLLNSIHGKIPLIIMRPTIIGATYLEPIEGWTDQPIAAAALYLAAGTGFLKFFPCNMDAVGDQIPVDIISNATLINTFLHSQREGDVNIIQVGSSARNPLTWSQVGQYVIPYWVAFPPQKSIGRASFRGVSNMTLYYLEHMFLFRLPIEAYALYVRVANKDPQSRQKAALLKTMARQQSKKVKQLAYFTTNEWFFEDVNLQRAMNALTKEDRDKFPCDVAIVDWGRYFRAFCWGLSTFVLKEKREHPSQMKIEWDSLPQRAPHRRSLSQIRGTFSRAKL